jgi:hypothetical protein
MMQYMALQDLKAIRFSVYDAVHDTHFVVIRGGYDKFCEDKFNDAVHDVVFVVRGRLLCST